MQKLKPVIIIVGYSRHNALSRLLESINNAYYPENVKLIISLDGGASNDVVDCAHKFNFKHGETEVITRKENIGLKNHIIWCGDQTANYNSVIVLEDDLLVDRQFYTFACSALNFYQDEKNVGGIALYSPEKNEYINLPFKPLNDGSSGYFMSIACSWGQAWTKDQWTQFKEWLTSKDSKYIKNLGELPDAVKNWPASSWKKYYTAYLVDKNKFFFYPYNSYTTNFSDAGGVHIPNGTNSHQVSILLQNRYLDIMNFQKVINSQVFYDSFFESKSPKLFQMLNIDINEIEIDFYAYKPVSLINKKKFALTTRIPEEFLKAFPLTTKPFEQTVIIGTQLQTSNEKQSCAYLTLSSKINYNKQSTFNLVKYLVSINFHSKKIIIPSITYMILEFSLKLYKKILSKIGI